MAQPRISLGETRRRLRYDRERLAAIYAARGQRPFWLALTPSFLCVFLYRVARLLFVGGHRIAARLVWQLNMLLTGADISPISEIGAGFVVVHPVSVTVLGRAGERLLIEGLGGMGSGFGLEDIGAGPGLPILGDDVSMPRGAMVLGPVRVGSRVRLGPGLTIVRDIPDDMEVSPHPVRMTRRRAVAEAGRAAVDR